MDLAPCSWTVIAAERYFAEVVYKAAMPHFHPRRIAFWLLACLVLSGEVFACSVSIPVTPFEPDVTAANRNADLLHVPGPPPVEVQVGHIRRTSSMNACDSFAEIDLVLSWPEPTALRWDEVGFYMHVVATDGAHPREGYFPEMVRVEDGKAHLTLRSLDSPAGGVLDFDVDIIAIDRGLRMGPPTRFHVHSNGRAAERFESFLTILARTDGEDRTWWMTKGLYAQVEVGAIRAEPCGPYSPYGCGPTETALLSMIELPYAQIFGETKTVKAACIGVRQSSGRVAHLLMLDEPYSIRVAAADWVDGADAGSWTRAAAVGCQAMAHMAATRESDYVEGQRKKHDRRTRRCRPCRTQ